MEGPVDIRVDFARYKYVEIDVDTALSLLDKLAEVLGKETGDMREARRYIENFDEFYRFMKKKFKDYLVPSHRPDDYIRGDVVIDKVRLVERGGERRVVLVFDRRVSPDVIVEALRSLGVETRLVRG